MTQGTSGSSLWEAEYSKGGIPSSVRDEPSGSVVKFVGHFLNGNRADKALDIGCGSGRNSIFLAQQGFEVTALDFASSQIAKLKANAEAAGVAGKVSAFVHDIRMPWPVESRAMNAVVDAFCFKHQIAQQDIAHYVGELTRVTASGARYMLSFAGRNDGYYSRFPVPGDTGPGQVIVDPSNSIASRLYDPHEIEQLFSPSFTTIHVEEKLLSNEMHGSQFERMTFVLWMERCK